MHLALSHFEVQPVQDGHGPESLYYAGQLHNVRHAGHAIWVREATVTQPRRGSAASWREKMAADAVAAAVFGEVLTAADVQRLRSREGALARFVPTLLRTHSHPCLLYTSDAADEEDSV